MWVVLLLLFSLSMLAGWFAKRLFDAPDQSRFDTPGHQLMLEPDKVSIQHSDVLHRIANFHRLKQKTFGVNGAKSHRRHLEDFFFREVEAKITPVDVHGIPGEWVQAEGAHPDRRLLYLHGGAFSAGSPRSHRGLTDALSMRSGVSVLAIDYRLVPEHKTVACYEDTRTAYDWMLKNSPEGPGEAESVFVAGDSAGGSLALALSAWARDRKRRAPDAVVAMAPTTDGTLSASSFRNNLKTDPFLGPALGFTLKVPRVLLLLVLRAMHGTRPNDPQVSPLLGDLWGLPPTLIQVSEQELLFDDSRRYANKAREAGSPVTLQVWPIVPHVFQAFSPELPEADDALDRIGHFLLEHATGVKTAFGRAS